MLAGSILVFSFQAWSNPVTAIFHLKEKTPMSELARAVVTPASARYQKYFSPEEIRDLAGPDQKEYDQLLSQLRLNGFEIVSESKTRLSLTVRGPQKIFERVLGARFANPSENQRRSLLAHPRVPFYLSLIEGISGLDNSRKAHPKYKLASATNQGRGFALGLSPGQVQIAYGFDKLFVQGISGEGQHIAIATYDDFHIDEVRHYYDYYQIHPKPSVDQVLFNGVPTYVEGSAMETQLDAEFSGMMAPGAQIHVFTSATNDDAGEQQMFTAILDDNRAKVVNYSWGSCETNVTPEHAAAMANVFARATAQGVSILVASGDTGSDSCGDGTLAADWPAGSPDVVAVGGTTLILTGTGKNEVAWNGSGGGISKLFDLPDYQKMLSAPFVKRSYPDVAFNADPSSGQAVYARNNGRPGWFVIGGTSMAAPQWAGFLALVGNARETQGLGTLGPLNPKIYALDVGQVSRDFTDITTGQNGAYSAGIGWDAVTGLGSMRADSLLATLVSQ